MSFDEQQDGCGDCATLTGALALVEELLRKLATIDPVYGPVRIVEPRKDPLDFDEAPRYTSRRVCGLCREQSEHQGENVHHKASCPWIPAREYFQKRKKA